MREVDNIMATIFDINAVLGLFKNKMASRSSPTAVSKLTNDMAVIVCSSEMVDNMKAVIIFG
jgi:hypothetical protein